MDNKKTSLFENGLIWFGAGVSLAEIITGMSFASLGFTNGLFAIIFGHIIGCFLLFLAGVIGGKSNKSAMETVKMSFGKKGSFLFAVLNVVQLVGWTSIMIYDGAVAANGIYNIGTWLWAVLIGILIILWILIGIRNLGKVNIIAMSGLFVLTIILSFIIFGKGNVLGFEGEGMSFGMALELSIAMPLSWLPLISDYTKEAEKPVKATAVSAITYGLVSIWMYIIGMGCAILANSSNIAEIMIKAGIGIAGFIIIILSTVTTTFLDAYSAGISSEILSVKIKGKWVAIGATVIGAIGAMIYNMDNISNFLYFIGSVFAPMVAILIVDFFILHKNSENSMFDIKNLLIWFIGFLLYRFLMMGDYILGSTIPVMFITGILCIISNKIKK